jgi:hypothetical protein
VEGERKKKPTTSAVTVYRDRLEDWAHSGVQGVNMRYAKYLAMLAVLMVPMAYSQAQVSVGVGVGPGYWAGPPACAYGYYDYAPYACAPYGFYGPDYFVGGVFIGAGPWFHWGHPAGFWRGGYGRGFYGRGYYGRGYAGRPYVGRSFAGRPGYVGRGPAARGFVGRGPAVRGGGEFHGGGGFHGGGFRGGRR